MLRDRGRGVATQVARVGRPSAARRVALALAVGLILGLAIGAVDAGRRADTSVERIIEFSRPADAIAFSFAFEPPVSALVEQAAAISDVAGVESSVRVAIVVSRVRREGRPRADSGPMVQEVPLDPGWGTRFHRYHVLEGRAPRPGASHEVAINERLSDLLDAGVGDEIVVELYAPEDIDVVGNGGLPATAAVSATLTVTGIQLRPGDLEAQPAAQAGTIEEYNQAHIAFSPAFWSALPDQEVALYGIGTGVAYAGGPAGRKAFVASAAEAGLTVEPDSPVQDRDALERSTRIEAVALYVLAGLVASAGALLVGSTLRRAVGLDSEARATLRALGVRRTEMAAAEVLRALPSMLGGGAIGLLLALIASPVLAFGISGRADPDPAVHLSVLAILLALVAVTALSIGGLFLVASRDGPAEGRSTSPTERAGGRRVVDRVAGVGAPPWVTAGLRMAWPAPGRPGRPGRLTLVAITATVALLVGVVTYAGSLRRLVTTPELRGWMWDVEVGNFSSAETTAEARRTLAANADIELAAGYSDEILDIDGQGFSVVGLERAAEVGVPVFEGRLPARRGEIALTGSVLEALGKEIGDAVEISLGSVPPQSLRIVGRSLGPGAVRPGGDLREGGIIDLRDWQEATESPGAAQSFVIRFREGVDEEAAARTLRRSFRQAFYEPTVTADVDSFRRTQPLLVALVVLLAAMAVVTLLTAVASDGRRRREIGLLKALGFAHGQVGAAVVVQALCLASAGIVIGLPIGLIAGRWAWIVSARAIGVVTTPVLSALVPAVVVGTLGASLLTSLAPARRARRLRTVDALRTE